MAVPSMNQRRLNLSPRARRMAELGERFMPRLYAFAYPMSGRGFHRSRRVAFTLWAYAFRVRVLLLDES